LRVIRLYHHRVTLRAGRILCLAGLLLALAGCDVPPPQKGANVVTPSLWLMTVGGGAHSLGIQSTGSASGTLWAWGDNTYGQLGDGTTTSHLTPTQIGAFSDWVYVVAGQRHSIGVRSSAGVSTLWAWGDNTYGQLGLGTSGTPVLVPTQEATGSGSWTGVPGVSGTVAAGCYHTLALRANGALFAWGANDFGQLGAGSAGVPQLLPTQVDPVFLYTQVAAGCTHSLGVRTTGAAVAWGDNSQGQLGNGTFVSASAPGAVTTLTGAVIGIAAGENYSLAIYQNPPPSTSQLWAWGYNLYGQLGDGTTTSYNVPTLVKGATNWLRVAAGQNHSMGVLKDGTAWVWGRNHVFQLGDGTTTNRYQPIPALPNAGTILQMAAGGNHTLAGTALAAVFDWGQNDKGQLGDGTTLSRSTPKALP
jgi:alpha-tubulin suppressor-like RCC1 family protein